MDVNYPNSTATLVEAVALFATTQCIFGYCFRSSDIIKDGSIFDYIIVGGGTAGCVLANRLTEDPDVTVALLEAGGNPPIESMVPGLSEQLFNTKYDWNYTTVNDHYSSQCLEKHRVEVPRGKMLGGGSSINGMTFIRAHYNTYDAWAFYGNDGWDFKSMLPYFKKAEKVTDPQILSIPSTPKYRGLNGNTKLSKITYNQFEDDLFEKAFTEFGVKISGDLNGKKQMGIGVAENNIFNSVRQSTAISYLLPAQDRPNLFILKEALVTKILSDRQNSIVGVKVKTKYGKINLFVNKNCGEVILSAGAINTPQLLKLSGIGPKEELQKFGIKVTSDLPVGYNLQDHTSAPLIFSADIYDRPYNKSDDINIYAQYFFKQSGALATNLKSTQMVFYSHNHVDYPDVQIQHVLTPKQSPPSEFLKASSYLKPFEEELTKINYNRDLLILDFFLMGMKSRGKVLLRSTNPEDAPLIYSGYGSNKDDLDRMANVYKTFIQMVKTDTFKKYNSLVEYFRIPGCPEEIGSPDYWKCFYLCLATTVYHPSCTAKMGPVNDGTNVVDSQLKVYGVKNLRIVDASIMPLLSLGNPNNPVMAMAEKAADIIKSERKHCYKS